MKRLLIILSALLFSIYSWSDEVKLDIAKRRGLEDDRSEYAIPMVTHDNRILNFYSEKNLDNLTILLKNGYGETIISESISLPAQQVYTIHLGDIENDVYILELKVDGIVYSGYVEIYQ